jgi:hypothetical protein
MSNNTTTAMYIEAFLEANKTPLIDNEEKLLKCYEMLEIIAKYKNQERRVKLTKCVGNMLYLQIKAENELLEKEQKGG